MTFQEIQDIIVTVLAPIGGVAGLIAIITGVCKVIAAAKNGKALTKYSETLNTLKSEMLSEIRENMNCTLDVDISARLNDVLENIEKKYLNKAQSIDEKLAAMRELNVEMARLMATTRKITEDKREELSALIDKCATVCDEPEIEAKPKLQITLGAKAGSDDISVISTKSVSNARHKITV